MTNIHPKIISHLKEDKKLNVLIENIPLYVDYTPKPVFDQLIRSIISQQLSSSAAQTIYNRFSLLLPDNSDARLEVLNLKDELLRSAGISSQKVRYIKNVAQHFVENDYKETDWKSWQDEEIIRRLTTIKGVGTWTVQMLLMFTLHREDILPVDDLVIKNSILRMYDIRTEGKKQVQDIFLIAEKWRPYRSIACRYLWAGKDIILNSKNI